MSATGSPVDIPEFQLTEEERAFREEVQAFVQTELEPLDFRDLEWRDDPDERIPWDAVEAAAAAGLKNLTPPAEFGGAEASTMELVLAVEELAVGDLGFAVILDQTWKIAELIDDQADPDLRERFFREFVDDPRHVLAITATEPSNGTNQFIPYEEMQYDTTAEKDGDEWVINGRKRYISNGADAKTYVVRAQTDSSVPAAQGTTHFLVPGNAEGLHVTHIHEKMSQRLVNNATVEFRNLRIPEENVLGELHGAMRVREPPFPSHIEAGASTLGVARAALESAWEHTNRRVQFGTEIINHQTVAHDLAEMAGELQAARALLWTAARAAEESPAPSYPYDSMAKVIAAETAVDVCQRSLELFGGAGIMLDEPVQKYFRDAISFLHSDGTQRAHKQKVINEIRGIENWNV